MVFAMQDHWRKHPMLTNCFKRPLPGFTVAAALVAGYYIVTGTARATVKLVTGTFPCHIHIRVLMLLDRRFDIFASCKAKRCQYATLTVY